MTAEEELLAIEARILQAGAGAFLDQIDELRVLLARDPAFLRSRVAGLVPPAMADEVFELLGEALALGARDAARTLGLGADATRGIIETGVSADLVLSVETARADAAVAVGAAQALALAGASPFSILAPLSGASTSLRRTLTSVANAARNDAVVAVSTAAQAPMTLVAERNACVHCLAHQGVVTMTGDFPAGLTYGARALKQSGRQRVPIHPHCRCRLEPVNVQSFADALRREANRSILRGYALPSESNRARLGAAERLLDSGVTAPASVKEFARRSIKRGEFGVQQKPGRDS